jgi:RNA 3'-terminal phosphate cyclase (ATP)
MRQIGFDAQLTLDQAGFYPEGAGRISATIRPAQPLAPLDLTERGRLLRLRGLSAVANLDLSIADRQRRQALRRLESMPTQIPPDQVKIKTESLLARSKGTVFLLLAEFEHGQCCYFSLGKLGKPAEQVANETMDAFQVFLDSDGTIDQYLADQLLLPLSLANSPSIFRTSEVTLHLVTNAAIIRQFLPVRIEIESEIGQPGWVRITPEGYAA